MHSPPNATAIPNSEETNRARIGVKIAASPAIIDALKCSVYANPAQSKSKAPANQ